MFGTKKIILRQFQYSVLAAVALLALIAFLYGPYISNPAFFDDVYLFADPTRYLGDLSLENVFDRRWVTTATLSLIHRVWGTERSAYHAASMLMHYVTVVVLFLFIRDLLRHEDWEESSLPAFVASAFFALHPVAAFATGYIIQQSILLAGLFSLLMWISVHRGIANASSSWLLASALFYYLAVFSKEHAITALPVAILVAWNASNGNWRKTFRQLAIPLPFWVAIALIVVLRMKGYIGSAYEPNLEDMLQGLENPYSAEFYVRSVVNQGWLFFKYGLFWLIPYEIWMSVDIREPFPPTWHSLPWLAGALAFVGYMIVVVAATLRGQVSRVLAIALLSPWLLFLTMFSAVQYQESFVLYRSYLWALPGTLVPALLLARLTRRTQIIVLICFGMFLFGLTWSRLQTFSDGLLVYNESVERIEGHDELPGAYRIYHNRGLAYMQLGFLGRAIVDFSKAIQLRPNYPFPISDRGFAYFGSGQYQLALEDFNRAIALKPDFRNFYAGRGNTLLKLNRRQEGLADLEIACRQGVACSRYQEVLDGAE